jgi:hypothetical protein
MNEFVLRHAAPALIVIVEVEGPTRLLTTANTTGEEQRLDGWIHLSAAREQAVEAALRDRGRARRQLDWVEQLRRDGGGIHDVVEKLFFRPITPA